MKGVSKKKKKKGFQRTKQETSTKMCVFPQMTFVLISPSLTKGPGVSHLVCSCQPGGLQTSESFLFFSHLLHASSPLISPFFCSLQRTFTVAMKWYNRKGLLSSLVAFKLCSPAPQEFFCCPRAPQWEKAAESAGFCDPQPHPDSPLPSLHQSSPLW